MKCLFSAPGKGFFIRYPNQRIIEKEKKNRKQTDKFSDLLELIQFVPIEQDRTKRIEKELRYSL